jgi:hypothetical protein
MKTLRMFSKAYLKILKYSLFNMDGAARRVGRLKETMNLDNLMLEELDFGSNDSPLQLMSPSIIPNKSMNRVNNEEKDNEPKIKAVGRMVANCHQDAKKEELEHNELAPLPTLKNNKKKADPRRQSTAIFSIFEATTSGNGGLLGDSEMAIGDEDMELLIPLAKSNTTLASKGINHLWVDPDTDDTMLEEALPEPTLAELQATASAEATAAPSPIKNKTPGKNALGVRDSVAMFSGFSLACDCSPGIDTVKEDEFLSPRDDNSKKMLQAEEKKEAAPVAPIAVRKPSRLKPPSSTSSFFSHTTTTNAPPAAKTTTAPVAVDVQPKKQQQTQQQPPKPKAAAAETSIHVVKKTVPVVENKILEQPKPPQPRKLPPSRLPIKSRLPRPAPPVAVASKPAVSKVLQPQRIASTVTTKPPIAKTTTTVAKTAVAKTPAVVVKTQTAATSSSPPGDDTPRTAHLKWLEAHPELAFGGGAKIANSPEADEVRRRKEIFLFICLTARSLIFLFNVLKLQLPKKKSAEDMHYESWGSSLTYELRK